jgi:hypothetical protein
MATTSSQKNKLYDFMKRKRNYLPQWEINHPWLSYNKETEKMFCTTCQAFPNIADKSSAFYLGSENFRLGAIEQHHSSKKHALCQKAVVVRDNPQQAPLARAVYRHLTPEIREKMERLFRTAYYLAFKEKPFSDFKDCCELQNLNGIKLGETYMNDKKCREFISVIAKMFIEDLGAELKNANAYAILSDGSTDSSVIEEEIIFIRFVKNGQIYTRFMSLQAAPNAKATGLKAAIEKALEDVGISPDNMVAMGTDGASVNTGCDNGLIALFRQDAHPWVLGFWCVAHQLELGINDAINDQQWFKDIKEVLQGLYKQYHYSPKALRELREVAEALEEKVLMPVNILGSRWSPHMRRALSVLLLTNFSAIYTHFDHQAEAKDSSAKMVGRARKVRGQLKKYKMLLYMHFMLDILEQAQYLSLHFQKDDCTLASACDKLQVFTMALEGMKTQMGLTCSNSLSRHHPTLSPGSPRSSKVSLSSSTTKTCLNLRGPKRDCWTASLILLRNDSKPSSLIQ